MKALPEAQRLGELADSMNAAKAVLRASYMPSLAVGEVERQLRAIAVAVELIADDLQRAQREAARLERQAMSA